MPKLKGRKTSWLLALALSLSGEFCLMQAAVAAAGLESYGYDALGRLIRVTYPTGEKIEYTYDAAGNRKTSGKGATPTITLTASPATDSFSIAANTVTTRTYTIANSGANAATALTIGYTRTGTGNGEFWLSGGTCAAGGSLAAGSSCTVRLSYGYGCGTARSNQSVLTVGGVNVGTPAKVTVGASYRTGICA